MATNTAWLKVEEDRIAQTLEEARGKLNGEESEVVLDFSSVRRIGPSVVQAMESLANTMNGNASRIALRGVNVDVYKVLKLTQLASRFSFLP